MRRVIGGALLLSLMLAVAALVQAADKEDAKGIIDKAIKATGGEEKLSKYKAATYKAKGKINIMGNDIEFTGEFAAQPPKQSRNHTEADINGMKIERIVVINGDKGWLSIMGNTDELPDDQFAAAKEELYAGWVVTLVPLKDAAFKLSPVAEAKVGDRPAVGVKVAHKDHKDINLYFDKEKGLLLKVQRSTKDMFGQEVDQETFYTDYKDDNGVQRSKKHKIKRDGSDFLELEITEFKPVEKLDDSMFAKPK